MINLSLGAMIKTSLGVMTLVSLGDMIKMSLHQLLLSIDIFHHLCFPILPAAQRSLFEPAGHIERHDPRSSWEDDRWCQQRIIHRCLQKWVRWNEDKGRRKREGSNDQRKKEGEIMGNDREEKAENKNYNNWRTEIEIRHAQEESSKLNKKKSEERIIALYGGMHKYLMKMTFDLCRTYQLEEDWNISRLHFWNSWRQFDEVCQAQQYGP